MVSFSKVNEILKTLPIGYYLGAKLENELEDTNTSYYDPMNNKIIIGYQQLPLDELTDDDPEVEDNIRCMLYHEISHAILTPDTLEATDAVNIFEDQRIETLLRNYFHRVDFKNFVRKVNHHFEPTEARTPLEYFFNIIRYGEGPTEFVERRNLIIKNYANLNKRSAGYQSNNYRDQIDRLFADITNVFIKEHAKPEKSKSEDEESEETKSAKPAESMNPDESSENDEETESTEGPTGDPEESEDDIDGNVNTSEEDEESEESKDAKVGGPTDESSDDDFDEETRAKVDEMVKTSIANVLAQYNNRELTSKMHNMIENAQRKKRQQASATTAYSGKLNPKLINRPGKIETYKWWEKSNTHGDAKRFSKIQLNLFCDVSGSFSYSENKINQIIKSLLQIEKTNKDFKLKLVEMGDTDRIAPDNKRRVRCTEGNYLANDIIDIYKKLQTPNTTIYNIVVFDGNAQSCDNMNGFETCQFQKENAKAFSAWNHPNCVVISDVSNQRRFEKWCPNAKRIYTCNYTAELEENVLKSMGLLLR